MRRGANDISCGEAWMRDSVRQLIWSVYSVYMQLMSLPCLQAPGDRVTNLSWRGASGAM